MRHVTVSEVRTVTWFVTWDWRRWGLRFYRHPSLRDGWHRFELGIGPFRLSWSFANEEEWALENDA